MQWCSQPRTSVQVLAHAHNHTHTRAHKKRGRKENCLAMKLYLVRFCTYCKPQGLSVCVCVCVWACETLGAKEQPAALCISSLIYQIPLLHYQQDHYRLCSLPSLPHFYWDSGWHTKISTHLTHSHLPGMLIILLSFYMSTPLKKTRLVTHNVCNGTFRCKVLLFFATVFLWRFKNDKMRLVRLVVCVHVSSLLTPMACRPQLTLPRFMEMQR